MNDLSYRITNLGLIEEEEDGNILQPSSRRSAKGQHTYASTSSGLGRPSGTPDDISGDEDVESITPLDDASSISSISPSKHLKSSFYRMASASKESLTSVRSMLLAPSFGVLSMSVRQLVQYLGSKHQLSKAKILDITTYQCRLVDFKHMFIVLRLQRGRAESWLRLDRRAEDPLRASFIFAGMQGPAKDVAKAASKWEELVEASDEEHSRIVFKEPPSLKVLESLLVAIYEESKDYRVWPENCWFFCSLMQEHLSRRHGGHFASGELYRPNLGSDARARISRRLGGIQPANLSVSRSRSLLYKVVPPLMPSTVIAQTRVPSDPIPRYLFFTPDGTRILHGTNRGIWVWDLSLRELINIPTEDASQVGDWASLLDGQIIVSGSSEGTYNFWDATDGTPIRFSTASRGSEGLHFTHLASAPDDLAAQRWERVIRDSDRWQGDPRVRNDRVAYVSEGSILVDEKSSNTRIANLNVGFRVQNILELSPSEKYVLFRRDDSYSDSYLWSIDTQIVYRLGDSRGFDVKDSPDGHYVAIEGLRELTIWDTRTGALVSILAFDSDIFVGKWSFSPDGRYIVAADIEGRVRLWDMKVALLRGPYRSNPPLKIRNGIVDLSQ